MASQREIGGASDKQEKSLQIRTRTNEQRIKRTDEQICGTEREKGQGGLGCMRFGFGGGGEG
jgi:hypothetical protein